MAAGWCYENVEGVNTAAFWVVQPRRLVKVYQSLRDLHCLCHQGDVDGGGSTDLCNADKIVSVHTALKPSRQPSSYSLS
jgi:hypothetical protein